MSPTPRPSVQGSQAHYFAHDVVRFFAARILGRGYEELAPTARAGATAFHFHDVTRTICRPADPLTALSIVDARTPIGSLRQAAAWYLRGRHRAGPHPLFRIPGLWPCGMIVHPRDTATVVVHRRPRAVWKLVRDGTGNAILDRERDGARLAPSLAPAVLDWAPASHSAPGYVRLEYALDSHPVTPADFGSVLRQITPVLMDARRRAGVTRIAVEDLDEDLQRCERTIAARQRTPFDLLAEDVIGTVRRALERHAPAGGSALHRAFAHGDIQASNLRRSATRVSLIDWGNAGSFNLLFDAFIVELFSPTPAVWHDILVHGTVDIHRGFQGWLPAYLEGLRTTVGVALSPPEIALALIGSLAEKTLAIIDRHSGADHARGLHSLGRIRRLLGPAAPTLC